MNCSNAYLEKRIRKGRDKREIDVRETEQERKRRKE